MPLERDGDICRINQHIVQWIRQAGLQVVLLDRDLYLADRRSEFNLVSLNHHLVSYLLTRHLIETGAGRIYFAYHKLTSSVEARLFGHYCALLGYGRIPDPRCTVVYDMLEPEKTKTIIRQMDGDTIVCVNGILAAFTVQLVQEMGIRIPEQMRIVGFDDMSMSKYLPPPLTTISQLMALLAEQSVKALVQRIARPDMPARDILLSPKLVVRKSCGASAL